MHEFCTIIASNYLPQASLLIESIKDHHPEVRVTVLITDLKDKRVEVSPKLTYLSPEALGVPEKKLRMMNDFYDVVEYATALKPSLLKFVLESGARTATYLDPDTYLLSDITDVLEISAREGIVLTPHRITPSDKHGSVYSDRTFLIYGTYNLGFISVSRNSMGALSWWQEKLEFGSTRTVNDHLFTDQKWVNLFPAFFECAVLKDSGINLAPWNLDERPLKYSSGVLFAGKFQLRLIHFSQMSSTLVRTGKSDHWGSTNNSLPEFQNSLEIINEITIKYGSRLMEIARNPMFNSTLHFQDIKKSPSILYKTIRVTRLNQMKVRFLRFPLGLIRNFRILDKSNTYVSLLTGIPQDYHKIRSRFRN
jgi:hypothetical protein